MHDFGRRTAAVVHQHDWLEVGPGGLGEGQPVGYRAGHGVLMRQDDPRSRIDQADSAYQTAGARRAVGHLVHVQPRLGVGGEYAVPSPRSQRAGGLRVPIMTTAGVGSWEDETNYVVRIGLFEDLPAIRVDEVIGRRGEPGKD